MNEVSIKGENRIWKPSLLDNACRDMVISSSWLYEVELDEIRMRKALSLLLEIYPILGGRFVDGTVIYPSLELPFCIRRERGRISDIDTSITLDKKYVAPFDVKGMRKGEGPMFSLSMTIMEDGTILSISASHLIMDGRCFYFIASSLLTLYRGEEVKEKLLFDDSVMKHIKIPQKIKFEDFYKIPRSILFPMLRRAFKKSQPPERIFISEEKIRKMKEDMGVSRTSIISAMVYELLGRSKLSIVQTVDHRVRVKDISSFYGGNASSPVPPIELEAGLSVSNAAKILDDGIKKQLTKDEMYFPSYLFLLKNKSPYLPFSLKDLLKKNPDTIVVNSFLSFDVYGAFSCDGVEPYYVFPPSLPDPVRLFPAASGAYIFIDPSLLL